MKFKDFYSTLVKNSYYVFSYDDIVLFYPDENRANLKKMIYRWKQKGWIYALKRGFYELTYPQDFIIPDMYIANNLYGPSCISLQTALSNYSIIPEVSMAVTSITTKSTREFKNKHGLFIYHTVRPTAFCGYYVDKQGTFSILIAEPEKALVDFLYFKQYPRRKIAFGDLRLDKDAVARLNGKKLNKYAKLCSIDLKGFYAYI